MENKMKSMQMKTIEIVKYTHNHDQECQTLSLEEIIQSYVDDLEDMKGEVRMAKHNLSIEHMQKTLMVQKIDTIVASK
jgi:hypothetical protein